MSVLLMASRFTAGFKGELPGGVNQGLHKTEIASTDLIKTSPCLKSLLVGFSLLGHKDAITPIF
jgi:hypothetical protein